MVDVKNLNRIKGILSAKQGAEIPKHLGGAKFARYNGKQMIYSENGSSWFMDEDLTTPYTNSLSDFHQIGYNPQLPKISTKPSIVIEIPGNLKMTPTTAVEQASAAMASAQQATPAQTAPAQTTTTQTAAAQTTTSGSGSTTGTQGGTEQGGGDGGGDDDNSKPKKLDAWHAKNAQRAAAKPKAANAVGIASQVVTSTLGAAGDVVKAKQAATDSDTTKSIDSAYNATAQGLQKAGGIAGIIGTAMQFGGIAGDVIQELGGGTDQQTKMDKWMDSAFFSWNIGMLNGFAGKNTQDFGADQSIISQVGGSYGGSVDSITDSAEKAGKKYGLFSAKARRKADAAIDKARSQQNLMGDIADTASDQRLAAQSMGEQAGLAYSMMTSGGYNQKYTYAAKRGGVLKETPDIEFNLESSIALEWEPQVEINWELPVFKEGGNIASEWIPEFKSGGPTYPQEYLDFIDDVAKHAPNLGNPNPDNYNLFRFWELNNKPITFKQAVECGMFALQDDGFYHGNSVAFNQDTGEYEWIKGPGHGTRWMERTFYDGYDFEVDEYGEPIFSEDQPLYDGVRPILKKKTGKDLKESEDFRAKYDLVEDENGNRKYVPKKFKDGGFIKDTDIPEIEETTQKNVIPEGALHKNKHHMEHAEGLTKKGIPVIDDDGDQQAEIEHSEIIFTLEVTKKLEEYYETFYSDESSNKEKEQAALDAGKLLVYQILENTEDRTGLIESCKNGGTLNKKDVHTSTLSDKDLMKEAFKSALLELLIK